MTFRITYILTLFFFFFISVDAISQSKSDLENIALNSFENGDFEKAAKTFEKLYSDFPGHYYHNQYHLALIKLNDLKTAEKVIKKALKKYPEKQFLLVDLGYVYQLNNDLKSATKEYEKALSYVKNDAEKTFEIASAFEKNRLFEYAIKTYLKFKDQNPYIFYFYAELGRNFKATGNYERMIDTFLDAITYDANLTQQVQNYLQDFLEENQLENKKDLLRQSLLKKIQTNPSSVIFIDMLVWLFNQDRNFIASFEQYKSLDKRIGNQDFKLLELAKLAFSNEDYNATIEIYNYIINKKNEFEFVAKQELLKTLKQKITNSPDYTQEDIKFLYTEYINYLKTFGNNQATAVLIKDLSNLLAFYMYDTEQAIKILNESLEISNLSNEQKAILKLELADILLYTGDIWEASLLYSQVEKSFKHDVIGQEAKFRNARLSYYKGDFEWAQAQLSVLKAATSKLISNDAIELSLLITDNLGLDSIAEPLIIFSRAELMYFQNKIPEALSTLDTLVKEYPFHSLMDDVLYKRYKILIKQKKFIECDSILNQIAIKYSDDVLGDDALFNRAKLNEIQLKNIDFAKKLYFDFIEKYPGSIYIVEARKRYRFLRGEQINN